ncbi:MAG TPA: hypothetical protein VM659_21200 [Dongiaceae bacterium]|nr:hypothetical protein [Dongiaceae bacterium]
MKNRSLILASTMISGLLIFSGCAGWEIDWKQSVHDSLVNLCDTQPNCTH